MSIFYGTGMGYTLDQTSSRSQNILEINISDCLSISEIGICVLAFNYPGLFRYKSALLLDSFAENRLREVKLLKVTQNVAESGFRPKQFAPPPVVLIQNLKTGGPGAKPDPRHVSRCPNCVFKS